LVKLLPKDQFIPIVVFYREHHLVDEFRKAGCRVIILKYPRALNLIDRFRVLGSFSPVRGVIRVIQKVLNFAHCSLVLFLRYVYLLKRHRVDLVHLNNGVMCATELLAASRLLGVRTVVHQRGIGALPKSFRHVRRLIDHVICVSEAARANLIKYGMSPGRCTTVHNGIDPEEFKASITRGPREVRMKLGIPEDVPVVGNAGMIKEWKGQISLVRAVERLRALHPRLFCLIIGGTADQHDKDAAYLKRIREYIQEHDLTECIQILDYQPNIAEFIQIFDIMVHTSKEPEPFSRSVLEGMTLGRAMVATRTGGTPEAIEDGVSGMLVPPDDPVQLAERIDLLLRRPQLREELGKRAEERIRERFLIQINVDSTQRVYERVFDGRACGER
jgi:glycosyltransferase involved in cell wall biosynthesis